MDVPSVLVVGAGPGVSGALARRYAAEGWAVGLVGRSAVDSVAAEVRPDAAAVVTARADLADPDAARAAVAEVARGLVDAGAGSVDVLHFNPSAYREKDPLELSVPELLADVALGVGGLLTAVQATRPFLAAGSRVTVTGSMAADRPWHRAASLGVQKAGLRNLVQSLDATLRPDGVRAVCVTVRGTLAADGPFAPDRVAATLQAAARQDEGAWLVEVPHDG